MKNMKCNALGVVLLCVSYCISLRASDSATSKTNFPKTGKTVLSLVSPKGKAEVTIETLLVKDECFDASPTVNFMKEFGAEEGSIVSHLSIMVAQDSISVPPSVYARLFNVTTASLTYKNGLFDLAIDTGVHMGAVHVYFRAHGGVIRLTDYDYVFRTQVEDARFHYGTLK
jgi:hypothetical protein